MTPKSTKKKTKRGRRQKPVITTSDCETEDEQEETPKSPKKTKRGRKSKTTPISTTSERPKRTIKLPSRLSL